MRPLESHRTFSPLLRGGRYFSKNLFGDCEVERTSEAKRQSLYIYLLLLTKGDGVLTKLLPGKEEGTESTNFKFCHG